MWLMGPAWVYCLMFIIDPVSITEGQKKHCSRVGPSPIAVTLAMPECLRLYFQADTHKITQTCKTTYTPTRNHTHVSVMDYTSPVHAE